MNSRSRDNRKYFDKYADAENYAAEHGVSEYEIITLECADGVYRHILQGPYGQPINEEEAS